MKFQVLGCAVLLVTAAACGGGGGGGGSGNKPPETSADGQKADDGQPVDPNALQINMEALAATNNSLQSESGKETLWSIRLTVNGAEKSKLDKVAFTDVSAAVKAVTFKRGDVFRFEMTIADKANPALVLATNLAEVAAADASLKSVWDSQCGSQVNPEVAITDGGLWSYQGSGGGSGKISLSVCDFAGVTLKPMVEIKPQAQVLDKKTVIYHCVFKPSTSTNELYQYTDTSCPYGYVAEAGETVPTISVLKKFAPGEPLYTTNILVLDDFKLNLSNAGTTQLTTMFKAPPFGSNEGCHTQKVDVKYGTPDGIKTARLTFKRQGQADGSVIWMPQNSGSWPSMTAIKTYYASSSDEKVHVYRICDWIPEIDDIGAGNVIQLTGG
jgi:hypothetical protein